MQCSQWMGVTLLQYDINFFLPSFSHDMKWIPRKMMDLVVELFGSNAFPRLHRAMRLPDRGVIEEFPVASGHASKQ